VPTTHLIKVGPERDPRFAGVVANEALCMHIVRSAGFEVAAFARVAFGAVDALVVTRYDGPVSPRGLVVRLHQEDAARRSGWIGPRNTRTTPPRRARRLDSSAFSGTSPN